MAIAATEVVPAPAAYVPVDRAPDKLEFVPYRNLYWVELPLGFTVPLSVAFVLDTEVADPVVAAGAEGVACVKAIVKVTTQVVRP